MVGSDKPIDGKNINIPFVPVVCNISGIKKDAVDACVVTCSITRESLCLRSHRRNREEEQEKVFSHNDLFLWLITSYSNNMPRTI